MMESWINNELYDPNMVKEMILPLIKQQKQIDQYFNFLQPYRSPLPSHNTQKKFLLGKKISQVEMRPLKITYDKKYMILKIRPDLQTIIKNYHPLTHYGIKNIKFLNINLISEVNILHFCRDGEEYFLPVGLIYHLHQEMYKILSTDYSVDPHELLFFQTWENVIKLKNNLDLGCLLNDPTKETDFLNRLIIQYDIYEYKLIDDPTAISLDDPGCKIENLMWYRPQSMFMDIITLELNIYITRETLACFLKFEHPINIEHLKSFKMNIDEFVEMEVPIDLLKTWWVEKYNLFYLPFHPGVQNLNLKSIIQDRGCFCAGDQFWDIQLLIEFKTVPHNYVYYWLLCKK